VWNFIVKEQSILEELIWISVVDPSPQVGIPEAGKNW
jgi:hypothetical protein